MVKIKWKLENYAKNSFADLPHFLSWKGTWFFKNQDLFLNDHSTWHVAADTVSPVISGGDCEQYFNFTFYTNITSTF